MLECLEDIKTRNINGAVHCHNRMPSNIVYCSASKLWSVGWLVAMYIRRSFSFGTNAIYMAL